MFQVLRDFFLDGATFKRVGSDVVAMIGVAATVPGANEAVAALFPGAGWVAPVVLLASIFYSARARQTQTPPKG